MILAALLAITLSGRPDSIHDGDTIRVQGERVRLAGTDAAELGQQCDAADGTSYDAGQAATYALAKLIDRQPVTCVAEKRDRYGRLVGTCATPGAKVSLNKAMVLSGQARAAYGEQYRHDEELAKAAHLGIWRGDCEDPAAYRRERRR